MSFFVPNESDQIQFIDTLEAESTQELFAFSVPQEVIDEFLRSGSNTVNHRMIIASDFAKQLPIESIVNVGSTAFLRYSGIMVRKDGADIGIPVSVITDCDVRPYDVEPTTKEKTFNEKEAESLQAKEKKTENIQMALYTALLHHDGRSSIALLSFDSTEGIFKQI